jgi:hypothetical protein
MFSFGSSGASQSSNFCKLEVHKVTKTPPQSTNLWAVILNGLLHQLCAMLVSQVVPLIWHKWRVTEVLQHVICFVFRKSLLSQIMSNVKYSTLWMTRFLPFLCCTSIMYYIMLYQNMVFLLEHLNFAYIPDVPNYIPEFCMFFWCT